MLKNKVIVCVFAVFAFIVHGKSDGTDEVSVSVTVMEGDSVTLYTTREKLDIDWYFNDIRIAYIHRDLSWTCTDVQCNKDTEKFRGRLKLDHQTGSLTITNIRNTDSGEYKLKISSKSSENIFTVSVSGAKGDQVKRKSVKKGESVTLETPVGKNPFDEMTLYFKDTPITKMTGDQSKICTDVQCKERFGDRLKLDHQTGSLTIMDTRTTDSGEYKVEITISNSVSIIRSFSVTVTDEVSVTVMEGDSVTLYTTREKEDIVCYFNDIPIVYIDRDQSKICTDVQCDEVTERFRGRLKLDHQTGSLTITNIRNTDSGQYKISSKSSEIIFTVSVSGAKGDQVKRKSVNEGESVTLETPVGKNPFDEMKWYFNDILIAEISGDQSKICRDVRCDKKFRGRLKLDHQTGSLTIMNTENTDAGEYKEEITISNSVSIIRSFSVTVTDPGLSPGAKAGIVVGSVLGALLLGAAVGGGIYYNRNKRSSDVDKENMHAVPYEVLKNDG